MKLVRLIVLGVLTTLFSVVALAGSAADDIAVHNAYVRAVPPGTPNSAAFMNLMNNGSSDHAIVRAESGISKVVELHTHKMEGGMMKMTPVEKIGVGANAKTILKPGGLHVMFLGLKQDVKAGDKVEFKLIFEDGSETTVTAPVKKVMAGMKHDMKKTMKH